MENQKQGSGQIISFSRTMGVNHKRQSAFQNLTNQGSPFRRSTISTSKTKIDNRNSLVDKSRIKELPNYDKFSLGNTLPFVVVFQAIEIERLSEEVEMQRVNLKECERLLCNATSFEVQIKELTEKCSVYETELAEYREQLQKMNKICEKFYNENESLKSKNRTTDWTLKTQLEQECAKTAQLTEELEQKKRRIAEVEKNKQAEIDEIKFLFEKQRKSMLARDIKELEVRHEAEVAQLMIEIRRVTEILESKNSIIEELKISGKSSKNIIPFSKQENKIMEYEEKISMLSKELIRVTQAMEKNSEEDSRNSGLMSETEKEHLIQIQQLRELIDVKEREREMQKQRINELEDQTIKNKELQHALTEVLSKLACMEEENEKLLTLIRQKNNELEKMKLSMLESEREFAKLKQYETALIQSEKKCKLMKVEADKLEEINKMRERQIEQYRHKCATAEDVLTQLWKLEKEKKAAEDKYKAQGQRMAELQLNQSKKEEEIKNLKMASFKQKETESIIDVAKKENNRLSLCIEQYGKQMKGMKELEKDWAKKYAKMRENQITIVEYQEKFQLITKEMENLGNLLKEKNEEITQLETQNLKVVGLNNKCKHLQSQLTEQQSVISRMRKDLEAAQQKIINYEQRIRESENQATEKLESQNHKLEKLQEELRRKQKEREKIQVKQVRDQGMADFDQVQKINQKQQNRITMYLRDLEEMRTLNRQYQDALEHEKRKTQELSRTIKRQSQKGSFIVESTKLGQSGKACSTASSAIETQKLFNKIEQLEETIKQLKVKYEELLRESTDMEGRRENSPRLSRERRRSNGSDVINNMSRTMIHEVNESAFFQ